MLKNNIHHDHMLIRMESIKFPSINDIPKFKKLLKKIISEIDMKLLGNPHIYYVNEPIQNKGITGICSITTSHLSFHVWENPGKEILQNEKSNCLIQFDVYTCGSLNKYHAKKILENLEIYVPTRIDIDILDRKKRLKLKYHSHWNNTEKSSFENWINEKF